MAPDQRSFALRGASSGRPVLLLHGLTASPPAWRTFADALHARGDTVVALRLRHHGYADRLTGALHELAALGLIADVEQAVARVAALGGPVTIAGHSLGAALALDVATRLPTVARVVAIAPFLGLMPVPHEGHAPLQRVLRTYRRQWVWCNLIRRERHGPPHGYPRYPLGALLTGIAICDRLATAAAPRSAIDIVLNAGESTINNRTARSVGERWRTAGAAVAIHVLHGLGFSHDIVEPERPAARAAFARLLEILA